MSDTCNLCSSPAIVESNLGEALCAAHWDAYTHESGYTPAQRETLLRRIAERFPHAVPKLPPPPPIGTQFSLL